MHIRFHPRRINTSTSFWNVGRDDVGGWVMCDDRGDVTATFPTRDAAIEAVKSVAAEGMAVTLYVSDHVIAVAGDERRVFTPRQVQRRDLRDGHGWSLPRASDGRPLSRR